MHASHAWKSPSLMVGSAAPAPTWFPHSRQFTLPRSTTPSEEKMLAWPCHVSWTELFLLRLFYAGDFGFCRLCHLCLDAGDLVTASPLQGALAPHAGARRSSSADLSCSMLCRCGPVRLNTLLLHMVSLKICGPCSLNASSVLRCPSLHCCQVPLRSEACAGRRRHAKHAAHNSRSRGVRLLSAWRRRSAGGRRRLRPTCDPRCMYFSVF